MTPARDRKMAHFIKFRNSNSHPNHALPLYVFRHVRGARQNKVKTNRISDLIRFLAQEYEKVRLDVNIIMKFVICKFSSNKRNLVKNFILN